MTVSSIDVLILMGSASDSQFAEKTGLVLTKLGLSYRMHVSSAHRTPERTLDLVRQAEADGCQVFICLAGMAAHLAGVVAAHDGSNAGGHSGGDVCSGIGGCEERCVFCRADHCGS